MWEWGTGGVEPLDCGTSEDLGMANNTLGMFVGTWQGAGGVRGEVQGVEEGACLMFAELKLELPFDTTVSCVLFLMLCV